MGQRRSILPYRGQTDYKLKIKGLSYTVPLAEAEKGKYVVWLNTLGDARLTNTSAKLLAKELKGCDVLVTLESYGIEFVHALATMLKQDRFVVCRLEKYGYMHDPICEYWGPKKDVKSAVFYLDSVDAKLIRGKRVGIVDEIVGARRAMDAMERLVKRAGGKVVKRVAMFSDGIEHPDIVCLGVLPVFVKGKKTTA